MLHARFSDPLSLYMHVRDDGPIERIVILNVFEHLVRGFRNLGVDAGGWADGR